MKEKAMTPSILQRMFGRTTQPSSPPSRGSWKATATIVALALGATSASASILAVNLDIAEFTPDSVVLGHTEANVVLFTFDEQQCVELNLNLATDQGVIPVNTRVNSHFIHGDPITSFVLNGEVRFQNNILGVISTSARLDATDDLFGRNFPVFADPTDYPTLGDEVGRGLEAADAYFIAPGDRAIAVTMSAGTGSDQIRVLTSCP
jgi:hypothetical protein